MISELPNIQVPEPFARICKLNLKNTRISYAEISDILQDDPFLKLYIQDVFKKYLKKGGMLGMLTALGWQGFRNRLAEAYIFYLRYGKYPDTIEMDEVHDVIDIEKRFDFLSVESSSRVFLFGFYLKICDIYLEKQNEFIGHSFITIPPEVDELLDRGKSRGIAPDWLIVCIWSLNTIIGPQETSLLMSSTKGNISKILRKLDPEHHDQLVNSLLKYGQGIVDADFLTLAKV